MHAPGGPVLIRVPACSRAVPEGCVAVQFPSEEGEMDPVWLVRKRVCVCEEGEVIQSEMKKKKKKKKIRCRGTKIGGGKIKKHTKKGKKRKSHTHRHVG